MPIYVISFFTYCCDLMNYDYLLKANTFYTPTYDQSFNFNIFQYSRIILQMQIYSVYFSLKLMNITIDGILNEIEFMSNGFSENGGV